MKCVYGLLVLSINFLVYRCEDLENDEEIPIIEGDGGTITTGIEDDVLILTRENFDLQVMSKNIILVEFYAPWCGHCKSLAPEYAKAAKILREEDPPIPLAKVDATVESELASRFQVQGFPTLFVFRNGDKFEYDGPRSAMGIVEYIKQQADPNWKPPPETVITLTNENFTDTVENADIILVEFYAPWCGHCKHLAPEYERAAKILNKLPNPIPLAKIDGTVEKDIANKYDAKGWPTLMIFRKGKKFPYNGPREESGIVSYMKEQALPASKEATSGKALKNAFSQKDVTIVGFFKSSEDALYKEFLDSANNLREKFKFHHTFDSQIARHFGAKMNTVVLFQPQIYASDYEPSQYEYSKEDGTATEITKFIRSNVLPLVGERSLSTKWKYQDRYPLVVVYYDVDFSFEHRVQTQLIRKEVAEVAHEHKGKITFAVSNEAEFEEELVTLSLDDSGEDVNVGYYKSETDRYRMDPVEDFSADELRSFIKKVESGKIPRQVKSLPPPRDNKGPVVTIVGSTFDELVLKNTKDVLLEFYAPWCGHCKKLEPIYKKLGKTFEANDRIMIAKIDATANDFPDQFDVKGFPTLIYVPAIDNDNIITYDGERTLKGLTDFVNEQLEKSEPIKDEL